MELGKHLAGVRFTGFDISDVSLFEAEKKAKNVSQLSQINFVCCDFDKGIPVDDKSFDFTLSKFVLPFVENKEFFLSELLRISKIGIVLVLSVFNTDNSHKLSAKACKIAISKVELHQLLDNVFLEKWLVVKTILKCEEEFLEVEVIRVIL